MSDTKPQAEHGCLTHFFGALGACAIAVFFPVLVFCWRNNEFTRHATKIADTLFTASIIYGIFVCPGTIILSSILMWTMQNNVRLCTRPDLLRNGAVLGALIAFFNIPVWLIGAEFIHHEVFSIGQELVLIAVTGALCGMYIGARAWRAHYQQETIVLRFSLRTLVLVVLSIGALMTIFQPNQKKTPSFEEILD